MSVNMYLNSKFYATAATNIGWFRLAEEVRNLADVETFPNMHHLAEFGWTPFLQEMLNEMKLFLSEQPPQDPEIQQTLREWVDIIGKRKIKDDDVFIISDGLSP